jgi:flagellar hook-basal body complex protein FliE
MTSKIGDSASSARSAIEAALRRHADAAARVREPAVTETKGAEKSDFSSALSRGIEQLESSSGDSDKLIQDVVTGRVNDFHEVAMRLKESELSFRFAMEVRNKFVDAYREVMRMSV